MPFVTIPQELFDPLAKRAASLNISVEQLITPLLRLVAADGGNGRPTQPDVSFDDWKKKFGVWMAEVEARAHRYPPGFAMRDSRESIYEGCAE